MNKQKELIRLGITPSPGVLKGWNGSVSGLIALAESLERGKKLVDIEKNKIMDLRAFCAKNDAVIEKGLLLVTVNDKPKENVSSYFENGTISYPLHGRLIKHVKSGIRFYINWVDKKEPYNHVMRLSIPGINEGFPEVKKNDLFIDAGFIVPESSEPRVKNFDKITVSNG